MSGHFHAVVWIDHHEARVFHFSASESDALADAGAILITGPANAKTALINHIEQHAPALKAKIRGVEALDHPTDGEILALARKFFKDEHQEPPRVR